MICIEKCVLWGWAALQDPKEKARQMMVNSDAEIVWSSLDHDGLTIRGVVLSEPGAGSFLSWSPALPSSLLSPSLLADTPTSYGRYPGVI